MEEDENSPDARLATSFASSVWFGRANAWWCPRVVEKGGRVESWANRADSAGSRPWRFLVADGTEEADEVLQNFWRVTDCYVSLCLHDDRLWHPLTLPLFQVPPPPRVEENRRLAALLVGAAPARRQQGRVYRVLPHDWTLLRFALERYLGVRVVSSTAELTNRPAVALWCGWPGVADRPRLQNCVAELSRRGVPLVHCEWVWQSVQRGRLQPTDGVFSLKFSPSAAGPPDFFCHPVTRHLGYVNRSPLPGWLRTCICGTLPATVVEDSSESHLGCSAVGAAAPAIRLPYFAPILQELPPGSQQNLSEIPWIVAPGCPAAIVREISKACVDVYVASPAVVLALDTIAVGMESLLSVDEPRESLLPSRCLGLSRVGGKKKQSLGTGSCLWCALAAPENETPLSPLLRAMKSSQGRRYFVGVVEDLESAKENCLNFPQCYLQVEPEEVVDDFAGRSPSTSQLVAQTRAMNLAGPSQNPPVAPMANAVRLKSRAFPTLQAFERFFATVLQSGESSPRNKACSSNFSWDFAVFVQAPPKPIIASVVLPFWAAAAAAASPEPPAKSRSRKRYCAAALPSHRPKVDLASRVCSRLAREIEACAPGANASPQCSCSIATTMLKSSEHKSSEHKSSELKSSEPIDLWAAARARHC